MNAKVLVGALLAAAAVAAGADAFEERTESTQRTRIVEPAAAKRPIQMFSAILMDPAKMAQQKAVTVKVEVSGMKLIDPADTSGQASASQGHLNYRLDNAPVIATAATQLSFQELSSGTHVITVQLAGNDGRPVGSPQVLTAAIP